MHITKCRMRSLYSALVLIALLPNAATACECFVPDICQRIESTPVIFLGETVAGGLEREQDAWRGTADFARLRVIERFRGVAEDVDEVEVSLFFWQGMCAPMPYRQGERTLVFLAPDENGKLRDGMCSASSFVTDGSEDLELVRRYFSGEMETTIRGVVTDGGDSAELHQPVAGATVVARRGGQSYSAVTDASGAFEIAGLQAGSYRLSPEKPGYTSSGGAPNIQVRANGCSTQELVLRAQNRLSGAVFDQDGKPVRNIKVFLQNQDLPKDRWGPERRTNAQGEFRFQEISPGSYYLVVSPQGVLPGSPYDRAFYGGGGHKSSAVPLEIAANSRLTGLDIFLGARYSTRTVTVRLSWPDGSTMEAGISCDDLTAKEPRFPYSESGWQKDEQPAVCTVLADRPYRIRAGNAPFVLPLQSLLEPREVVLPAGKEDVQFEFVLSEADYARSREALRKREEQRRLIQEDSRPTAEPRAPENR